MSRILNDLERGPIALKAFSAMASCGLTAFDAVDSAALAKMPVPKASRLIVALFQASDEAKAISDEFKLCHPVYMNAWLRARRVRKEEIAKKNDLTKKI